MYIMMLIGNKSIARYLFAFLPLNMYLCASSVGFYLWLRVTLRIRAFQEMGVEYKSSKRSVKFAFVLFNGVTILIMSVISGAAGYYRLIDYKKTNILVVASFLWFACLILISVMALIFFIRRKYRRIAKQLGSDNATIEAIASVSAKKKKKTKNKIKKNTKRGTHSQ